MPCLSRIPLSAALHCLSCLCRGIEVIIQYHNGYCLVEEIVPQIHPLLFLLDFFCLPCLVLFLHRCCVSYSLTSCSVRTVDSWMCCASLQGVKKCALRFAPIHVVYGIPLLVSTTNQRVNNKPTCQQQTNMSTTNQRANST